MSDPCLLADARKLTYTQEQNGDNSVIVRIGSRTGEPLSQLRNRFALVTENFWPHLPRLKLRASYHDLSSSSKHCYHSMKEISMGRHCGKKVAPMVDTTVSLVDDVNGREETARY